MDACEIGRSTKNLPLGNALALKLHATLYMHGFGILNSFEIVK
jgi:hypothetical protein